MQSYATLFFICFVLCLVIILSSGYGFSRRAALDESAIQSAHSGFVPRVGGLAIYISILGLIPLLSFGFIPRFNVSPSASPCIKLTKTLKEGEKLYLAPKFKSLLRVNPFEDEVSCL